MRSPARLLIQTTRKVNNRRCLVQAPRLLGIVKRGRETYALIFCDKLDKLHYLDLVLHCGPSYVCSQYNIFHINLFPAEMRIHRKITRKNNMFCLLLSDKGPERHVHLG